MDSHTGSNISSDVVRDWQRDALYLPLAGQFFVKFVNEIDTITNGARTEIHDYLDELPPSILLIATTNKAVKDIQEQLQSRFQVWKFDPCSDSESR